MRVLVLHTRYQQAGGEDAVFAAEVALLRVRGHEVIPFTLDNCALGGMPPWRQAAVTVWNRPVYRQLRSRIRETSPRLVHVHNTFPLASPVVIHAAKAEGAPVVATLHNYRLVCPNALLFREGKVCEHCLGRFVPWPGVRHACYRQSRAATAAVAAMLVTHRLLHTWDRMVDVYIALTEFARQKFIEGGLSADRIVVKPNFVYPDPGPGGGAGRYALFVGRLVPEKGIRTLLAAWDQLGWSIPLRIVGSGPLAEVVCDATRRSPRIEWLGARSQSEVYRLMGDALAVVVPSEWYETFGRVIVEAYAVGTPVVASSLGALAELVEPGRTGLRFRPGDPADLAAQVEWLWTHPAGAAAMRREARAEFEAKYTAECNYQMLMEIYRLAIKRQQERR